LFEQAATFGLRPSIFLHKQLFLAKAWLQR